MYDTSGDKCDQWDQIQAGNKKALDQLFNRYVNILYGYGCALTPDRELVKDSIQDLFLNIWERRDHLPAIERTQPYLQKALRQIIFRKLAASNNHTYSSHEPLDITVSREAKWVADEEQLIQSHQVDHILKSLPPRQREIVFLKFYQNMSYEDIALNMGISYQVARNSLYRTMKKLRAQLNIPKKISH